MIKALFLPTRIGTNRLIAERIVGLNVTETHVHAVVVFAKQSKTAIEKTHIEVYRDWETLSQIGRAHV